VRIPAGVWFDGFFFNIMPFAGRILKAKRFFAGVIPFIKGMFVGFRAEAGKEALSFRIAVESPFDISEMNTVSCGNLAGMIKTAKLLAAIIFQRGTANSAFLIGVDSTFHT
jgi:hypothetical protein